MSFFADFCDGLKHLFRDLRREARGLARQAEASVGSDIRPRASASICCSPPDKAPAICERRSRKRGNISYIFSVRAKRLFPGAVRIRAEAKIVGDGQFGKHQAAFRNERDPRGHAIGGTEILD